MEYNAYIILPIGLVIGIRTNSLEAALFWIRNNPGAILAVADPAKRGK